MPYYPSPNGRSPRLRSVKAQSWKTRQQPRLPLTKRTTGNLLRGLSVLFFDDDSNPTNLRFW